MKLKEKNKWPSLLEDYLIFIGEPNKTAYRNSFILILALIYILAGILCLLFPNNIIINFVASDSIGKLVLIWILILGGWYMFIYGTFLKLRKKYVDDINHKMGLIMWFLFLLIVPFELMKKIIQIVLNVSRQKETIQYIPEFFLSLALTLIITMTVYLKWGETFVNSLHSKTNIVVNDETITLILVVLIILTFFYLSKIMICELERLYIYLEEKRIVKSKSKINYRKTLNDNLHLEQRQKKYAKRMTIINRELDYSRIYFYLIVNIILLCIHIDPSDIYGTLFKNTFLGVTTLAALIREVQSRYESEKISK